MTEYDRRLHGLAYDRPDARRVVLFAGRWQLAIAKAWLIRWN